MLDPGGHIVNWKPGAERTKGYKREEVLGRHFSTFYTEEDRRAGIPTKALSIAAQTGKFEAEEWRVRKDESRFWASVVINAIKDVNGEIVGFAKITRDLTERRAADEASETGPENGSGRTAGRHSLGSSSTLPIQSDTSRAYWRVVMLRPDRNGR